MVAIEEDECTVAQEKDSDNVAFQETLVFA